MFKLWAKTIKGEKITKSFIYKGEGKFDISCFRDYLCAICDSMDLPTPVLLKSHTRNFASFNTTKFTSSDFVESVDFDKMIVEYCRDDQGEKKHIYKAYLPTD